MHLANRKNLDMDMVLDVWGNTIEKNSKKIGLNIITKEETYDINEFYKKIESDKEIQNKIIDTINTFSFFNRIKDENIRYEIINSCILFAIENNCKSEEDFWVIVKNNKHAISKQVKNDNEIYDSEYIDNDHANFATIDEYERIENEIDSKLLNDENENDSKNDSEINKINHLIDDVYGKVTQRQAEIIKAVLEFLDLHEKSGSTKKPTQTAIARYVSSKTGKHITRQSLNLIIIRLTARINKTLLSLVGTKNEYVYAIKQTLNRLDKVNKNTDKETKKANVISMQTAIKEIKEIKKQGKNLYQSTNKVLNFKNFVSKHAYNYYLQLKSMLKNTNNTGKSNGIRDIRTTGLSANKPVASDTKPTTIVGNKKTSDKINIVNYVQIIKNNNTQNKTKTINANSNNNEIFKLLSFASCTPDTTARIPANQKIDNKAKLVITNKASPAITVLFQRTRTAWPAVVN